MDSTPVLRTLKDIFFSIITAWLILSLVYNPQEAHSFSSEDISGPKTYAYHKYPDLLNWQRPDKPITVGLQVGHWKVEEHPEELKHLRNNTGAQAVGFTEVQVNYAIVLELAKQLQKKGITVEILPATVPKGYWADLFLSIHADGDHDVNRSGYKASTSWYDYSGLSQQLVDLIKVNYGSSTGLSWDENITSNMLGYYAFNWWKNDHAIHPMTPAVIVETGFLTNPSDRELLTKRPDLVAAALSDPIIIFLNELYKIR